MPRTRNKVIKTVYTDDEDSGQEDGHDFSDSGSEAEIPEYPSSEEEEEAVISSDEDFKSSKSNKKSNRSSAVQKVNKAKITKSFNEDSPDVAPVFFSVKNLTDADKLLPSILNLSESDSSDDETPVVTKKKALPTFAPDLKAVDSENETESNVEYKDVWSNNIQDESEEVAKRTFLELQQAKSKMEETKMSIQNYSAKMDTQTDSDVKDLLALGEEEIVQPSSSNTSKKRKPKIVKDDSDSEMEDWEEVKEAKGIPQQGLQLIVDIPGAVCRKTKKIDVEMMMKRKINRVKKEYQVYMHKVHVLCWLAHGNYISKVLNDQTIMAAALTLVPSKECYPGERVDMKYVEQITTWYKDKVTLKQDKNENKFRPKALPLKEILQQQMKNKIFTTKKYIVFVFVAMLRSLGLQCRVMFNFVTVPIKPLSSELCSLSTKKSEIKNENKENNKQKEKDKKGSSSKSAKGSKEKISQLDGNDDMSCSSDSDNIMQIDGSDDSSINRSTRQRNTQNSKKHVNTDTNIDKGSVSPPKRPRRNCTTQPEKNKTESNSKAVTGKSRKSLSLNRLDTKNKAQFDLKDKTNSKSADNLVGLVQVLRTTRNSKQSMNASPKPVVPAKENKKRIVSKIPEIIITSENSVPKKYGSDDENSTSESRKRPNTTMPIVKKQQTDTKKRVRAKSAQNEKESKYFTNDVDKPTTTEPIVKEQETDTKKRVRAKSAQNEKESKYFTRNVDKPKTKITNKKERIEDPSEDSKRISHKDLQKQTKPKNDVKKDLIQIIKGRVKEAKEDAKKFMVKERIKKESDEDSDYLPVLSPKDKMSESDDDFKPKKISPKTKPKSVKKVDRRVLSTDDESQNSLNKMDVWCEVFVEELEEWIAVDVIRGNVHCVNEIYSRATHPVNYAVGWDNSNYLKDLTRKYVPHWNTVTRKQRVEPHWWDEAIKPWLGPKTARDREEDERLDRMQLEAPLPKAISEYKNHPLYALKRHLLKFEAIYPPDAPTLGFVRGEAVYARGCVHVCRSRDTWLKEAKVVRLGETPYKVVKARPKWDKLSNKLITDKPLEVFGPWQVQDYEPPVAENGIVPRNAYGNVELFKDCMLPKGTVHLKFPGLNRVAKKLNIDCAPAMTGFEFNGGWSHPVYEGFVVCKEYEDIITDAWIKDQEDQERKEQEKTEARVYGNWRRLIRGLLIKERLKAKYGFEEPSTSQDKKQKGPRLVVKKR